MSTAVAIVEPWIPPGVQPGMAGPVGAGPPQLVSGMRRYLLQLTTFLSPRGRFPDLQPARPA